MTHTRHSNSAPTSSPDADRTGPGPNPNPTETSPGPVRHYIEIADALFERDRDDLMCRPINPDPDYDWRDQYLPSDEITRRLDGITPSYAAEHVRIQEREARITAIVLLILVGLCVVLLAVAATVVIAEPVIHPDCMGDPRC